MIEQMRLANPNHWPGAALDRLLDLQLVLLGYVDTDDLEMAELEADTLHSWVMDALREREARAHD